MKLQELQTQALWDDQAKKEMKFVRRQQFKRNIANWMGITTFCVLILAMIWGFSTYGNWLPALVSNFEEFIERFPERVVYSEYFPKIIG